MKAGGEFVYKDVSPAIGKLVEQGVCPYTSYAAYARIFIPDVLDEEGRILYLDCDTLVDGPLDELFARSDVIFLHCPLFPSTEGIINKDNIAKMKDGVILINNSRGQLVVEQDLADALNSGKVYAAGLDVVSTEPIGADNPLKTAKNTFITPHISWAAQAARQRIMDITVDNIGSYVDGAPINVVNK